MHEVQGASIGCLFAVAGLDLSLNEIAVGKSSMTAPERKLNHVWAPHVHIVLMGRDPEIVVTRLKHELQGIQVLGDKHMRSDRCYCVGRTIAYATKLNPERREVTSDARGNADRKLRPLASKPMNEALNWLASAKANTRIFTHYKPS